MTLQVHVTNIQYLIDMFMGRSDVVRRKERGRWLKKKIKTKTLKVCMTSYHLHVKLFVYI